ncbi:MAG: hypothetical protein IPJ04_10900 [Candidatus Eisenbacteria bacterium]|nr:hypothetical protein [Candidatus Eisenbacteria bacterium]
MIAGSYQRLLPGDIVDQLFTPSPRNGPRMSASRSMAFDTARRKSAFENHEYFAAPTMGSPGSWFGESSGAGLRLNQRNDVLNEGPLSYSV